MRTMSISTVALVLFFVMGIKVNEIESQTLIQASELLGCNMQQHKHKVKQTDSRGRICSGEVNVLICKGRCDSKEISDWKFPYKRAFHPVCLHVSFQIRRTVRADSVRTVRGIF